MSKQEKTQYDIMLEALNQADWSSAQGAIRDYLFAHPQAAMSWVEWLGEMAQYGREVEEEFAEKDLTDMIWCPFRGTHISKPKLS